MLGEQQEVGQPLLVNDAKRLKGDEPANAKVAIGDINQGNPQLSATWAVAASGVPAGQQLSAAGDHRRAQRQGPLWLRCDGDRCRWRDPPALAWGLSVAPMVVPGSPAISTAGALA